MRLQLRIWVFDGCIQHCDLKGGDLNRPDVIMYQRPCWIIWKISFYKAHARKYYSPSTDFRRGEADRLCPCLSVVSSLSLKRLRAAVCVKKVPSLLYHPAAHAYRQPCPVLCYTANRLAACFPPRPEALNSSFEGKQVCRERRQRDSLNKACLRKPKACRKWRSHTILGVFLAHIGFFAKMWTNYVTRQFQTSMFHGQKDYLKNWKSEKFGLDMSSVPLIRIHFPVAAAPQHEDCSAYLSAVSIIKKLKNDLSYNKIKSNQRATGTPREWIYAE